MSSKPYVSQVKIRQIMKDKGSLKGIFIFICCCCYCPLFRLSDFLINGKVRGYIQCFNLCFFIFTIGYLQWHIYTFPTKCTYFRSSSIHTRAQWMCSPSLFPSAARTKVWSCNCIIWMSGKYNLAEPLVRTAFCVVSDSRYFGGVGEGGHWAEGTELEHMCAHMNHMSASIGFMFCWDCEAQSEKLQHLNSFQQVVFAHPMHHVSRVSLSF